MVIRRFRKGDILLYDGELLKGIILVRAGVINVRAQVSLFDSYTIEELYPRCSYGSYAYFADADSKHKNSKFTLEASQPGEYYFIKYSLLDTLAFSDASF